MFIPKSHNAIKVYEQKNAIYKNAEMGNYYISSDKFNELKGFEVFPNDIIVSCAGTIGEAYVMPINIEKGIINQALMKIKLYDERILDFYLLYFDFILKNEANEQGKGTAIKNIPPFDVLKNFLIPLPPIEEQKRIINFLKRIDCFIQNIENCKNDITTFIKQTKSKVLDLAIRGKLVPQDPNDEPASVLLEKILNEQKTKKPTACILHYPFEVPKNWTWCRLGEIGSWSAGTTPSRTNNKYYENATIPWLKTGDLNDSVISYVSEYVSELALKECKQLRLNAIGSVAIALYGVTIGKCGILDLETTTNQACCVCKTHSIIFNKYLFYFLLSHREQFKDKAEGGAQPNISKDKIVNSLVPLPPLPEQQRIVKKIESIFKTLDSIQNNI